MIRLAVIKVVVEAGYPASTPRERWSAARELGSNFTGEDWLILLCVAALIVLVAVFCWISVRRLKNKERKALKMSYEDLAGRRGLSERESQLLGIVADRAGLKRAESVFTMGAAFGIGAMKVIEDGVEGEVTGEKREQLKAEIGLLREKLGFGKRQWASGHSAGILKNITTRDIPVGKRLYVTRRRTRAASDIESTVVRNSDTELAVTLSQAVKITFGETWCVRYYAGASVWEFDTAVVSFDGDKLVLEHSDHVRFVNRRRFLRVPVRLDAFVARFPFTRTPRQVHADEEPAGAGGESCRPPEFARAVVTELAGPGLRIEVPLEVKAGERVLVVFNLNDEGGEDLSPGGSGGEVSSAKIVEDIGEVRHSRAIENGCSIAVELTGLSDPDVDKLVQVTNGISLKTGEGSRGSTGEQEPVAEALAAQGV